MNRLRLAVISDLHVGHGARAKDLCPHPDADLREEGFTDSFVTFLKREKIRADYMLLPGDVSHRAQPDELSLASDVLLRIAQALGVSRSRILFVPGNHDVDWSVMTLPGSAATDFRRSQRFAALANKQWLFGKLAHRSALRLLEKPYLALWEFPNLLVAGCNSSWHDDPAVSTHHGLISTDDLQALDERLAELDLPPERVKVFLVHHHPVQYSDPIAEEPDFSVMVNAENLLTLLHRRHFDLLIHGHKHAPRFRTHISNAGFPLAILGAGSFSAQLDTRWSGYVNNQFHMVELDGRDGASGYVFGAVKSWTFLCGRGWIESQKNNGIRHVLPFGTYLLPNELAASVRPIIVELMQTKAYVEWKEVVQRCPRLEHLPPERIIETLDALAREVGFRRHGDPPDDIILLKEY
jgi:UDP-2,3-diacylglucosamine pyrophosphatase LpxH